MTENWLQKLTRIAAKLADINELHRWNQITQRTGTPDYNELRNLLGKISSHMNEISLIFKQGVRGSNLQTVQRAAELLPDISNIEGLHNELNTALQYINKDENPQGAMLFNMMYSLLQMNFTPEQKHQFINIANGTVSQPTYTEEASQENLQSFLQTQIYSIKDSSTKTMKVFREVLQNAGDAAIKQKRMNPEHQPMVQIYTESYVDDQGDEYMDLMVIDNGVGMNWEILSKKFFVYFQSGKSNEPESTGGFGIAKAVIQETPEHGWSIDSNGIHSSKFNKNIYMGTPSSQPYNIPSAYMNAQGTSLTLYKLPNVGEYSLIDLCKKFSSNELLIQFNGVNIDPLFDLSDMHPIEGNMSAIAKEVSKNTIEERHAQAVINVRQEKSDISIGELKYPNTVINFYVQTRESYSGKVYFLLNGQFQFDSDWIEGADIICSIQTTERPGSDVYPVDPGRDNLRSPYKEESARSIEHIKEILKAISESSLFKEGLDLVVYNKDQSPLTTHEGYGGDDSSKKAYLKRVLEQNVIGKIGNTFTTVEEEDTESEVVAKQIEEQVSQLDLDQRQHAIVRSTIEALARERDDNIDITEEIEKIIEGLTTPLVSAIQKNFVSRRIAHEDPTLTANLAVLWQTILRKIVTSTNHRISEGRVRQYAPGIVYSDKALALYSPAKMDQVPYDVISINPIAVASIVHPAVFTKWLSDDTEKEAFKDAFEKNVSNLTPINRLSSFLFHSAIHEITHLYYPDFYGHDNFHNQISHLESVCHFLFGDIREEVKRAMPGLKKDSMRLIRAIRDERGMV